MTRPSPGEVLVGGERLCLPGLAGGLVDGLQPVGGGLVGADEPEVAALGGVVHDLLRAGPPRTRVGSCRVAAAACRRGRRSASSGGSGQVPHAAARRWRAGWRRAGAAPSGTQARTCGGGPAVGRRRAPRAGTSAATSSSCRRCSGLSRTPDSGTWWARQVPSTGCAVDLGRAGPALGGAQHDHRPARRARSTPSVAGRALDRGDAVQGVVHGARPCARWTCARVVAGDVDRLVAVAAQQGVELGLGDPGQHGRVGDLVAVEVQDRQDRAVVDRVEELVGVPGRGQRPGLRLAVADHAGDQQIRVVEGGAVGVGEGVAELAALVDRARCLRRDMAGHAAGEGELPEQPGHARRVPARRPGRSRCRCPPARSWRARRGRRGRGPRRTARPGRGP